MSSFFLVALLSLSLPAVFFDKGFDFAEIQGPEAGADPDTIDDEVKGPVPDAGIFIPVRAGLRILADRVLYTKKQRVVDVIGHVEVHSPPFIVFADKVRVDFAHKRFAP